MVRLPSETATNTVPTGFWSVPPEGPAIPVVDTPMSVPLAFLTPSAMRTATSLLTAPCCLMTIFGHTQQLRFRAVAVRDNAALEVRRASRDVGDPVGHEAARERLGHADRELFLREQRADHPLEGVLVVSEDVLFDPLLDPLQHTRKVFFRPCPVVMPRGDDEMVLGKPGVKPDDSHARDRISSLPGLRR